MLWFFFLLFGAGCFFVGWGVRGEQDDRRRGPEERTGRMRDEAIKNRLDEQGSGQ